MNKKKTFSYAKYGYIFSIPFVVVFCIFTLYPVFYTAFIGFTDLKGVTTTEYHVLDDIFANYKSILANPNFQTALKNTFVMWVFNFIPQMSLGLLLAAWFTNRSLNIKGQGFFKVVFYMPNIITAATVAILFGALMGYPKGPINDLLQSVGFLKEPLEFFRNKYIAQGTVEFIQFWMWYGYTMIIMISGILGINPEIFEAAEIDGATGNQIFFHVTVPNLRPIVLYMLVTSLIGGLQMFDIPKLLVTNSGPDNATLTTSVFIHGQAFSGAYMYNRASAASMIMFLIISVFSVMVFFMLRDKDEIEKKKQEKRIRKEEKLAAKKGGNA